MTECQDCRIAFDSRGSKAMRLCRKCIDGRRRRGEALPEILCVDCDAMVPPKRGFRAEVRCDRCQAKREKPSLKVYTPNSGTDEERRQRACARKWRAVTGLSWLTWEHLYSLLVEQDHKCLICSASIDACTGEGTARSAHLDHDHDSGVIRGWLCGNCNRGLGQFLDSRELLLRAAEYLESRADGVRFPQVELPERRSRRRV